MKRITRVLVYMVLIVPLLAPSGCAFLTTKRVVTMAGKHVAKKTYEKMKEDREEKKRQEQEREVRPASDVE